VADQAGVLSRQVMAEIVMGIVEPGMNRFAGNKEGQQDE
jgi:hypothetical protein